MIVFTAQYLAFLRRHVLNHLKNRSQSKVQLQEYIKHPLPFSYILEKRDLDWGGRDKMVDWEKGHHGDRVWGFAPSYIVKKAPLSTQSFTLHKT
jgi:hypothetical protein